MIVRCLKPLRLMVFAIFFVGVAGAATNPLSSRAVAVNVATNMVYIANCGSVCGGTGNGNVTVVDGVTNSHTTIMAGTNPYAIAVNPITDKIYVLNYTSGDVTVIDAANQNAASTVKAGTHPVAIAVNQVTNTVYVANEGSNTVTEIDAGSGNNTTTITVGTAPVALAVNANTNMIYAANNGSGNVTAIDGATRATTAITAGTAPIAVTVDATAGMVYAANFGSANVTAIDTLNGNATSTIAVGTHPEALLVDAASKTLYVANSGDNTVTVFTPGFATTTVAVGTQPIALALDPLDNQIYVSDFGGDVRIIDGSMKVARPWIVTSAPSAVAVNPVTGQVYFANGSVSGFGTGDGRNISFGSIYDGLSYPDFDVQIAVNPTTNTIYALYNCSPNCSGGIVAIHADGSTTPVSLNGTPGGIPGAVAVNPVTGLIYISMYPVNQVLVLDGTTLATQATVAVDNVPANIVVNPVTNKIYVVTECGTSPTCSGSPNGSVTVIDGATNGTVSVPTQLFPGAAAVNPVTNKIYVANSGSNTVTVIDGATNVTATVPVGEQPRSVAVNPVTNRVYVANYSNSVSIIDGTSNAVTAISVGANPTSIAVNSLTNKIYTANQGTNGISVIDGATNVATGVALYESTQPQSLAVNPATNKVYVAVYGSPHRDSQGYLEEIDGRTNLMTNVGFTSALTSVVVNPNTNTAYAEYRGGSLRALATLGPRPRMLPMTVAIAGVVDSQTEAGTAIFATTNVSPSFTATVTSGFSPVAPAPTSLYYQVDSELGPWQLATKTDGVGTNPGNFTFSLTSLPGGLHTIYAYAGYGGDGTPESGSAGTGNSPQVSNLTPYTFAIIPAQPAAMISPVNGTTLPGTMVTFLWSAGVNASAYTLSVGTTPGAHDLKFINTGLATTTTFSGLPHDGSTLYVTLNSEINGVWYPNAYTYVATGSKPATMISPASGTKFAGSSVTFTWTTGVAISQYSLYIGTHLGEHDIAYINAGTNKSATASGLPTTGGTIFVRLYSLINGAYQYNDYSYFAAGTPAKATMTSPTNGTTLSGRSATFTWAAGTGVTSYSLYVGTSKGANDIDYIPTTSHSTTVTNLPALGTNVYVRLWSLIDGAWQYADYSYPNP